MNLLLIYCYHYHFYYADGIPLSTRVAIGALLISLLVFYFNYRFQLLYTINSKLSEMSKECDKDVDFKGTITETGTETSPFGVKETIENISHIVSTIISANQLLNGIIKRNKFFVLKNEEQACIEKFYFQIHTSVRAFIMDKNRHENFIHQSWDLHQQYHIMLQIKYCQKWFNKTYSIYGIATPLEILSELEKFKRLKEEDKLSELHKLSST